MLNGKKTGRIILLRHAQTVGGKGRAIGHTHLPLSAEGAACAEEFGQLLQGIMRQKNDLALYSSPSQRALESFGEIYAKNPASMRILPACQEIFLGDWEGLPFADIKAQWPDLYEERGTHMATFRPPYTKNWGENFAENFPENFYDVQKRMLGAITSLAHEVREKKATAILISHAGCIRSLLCHFLGTPLENIMQIKVDNLHGMVIDCHDDGSLHLASAEISYLELAAYI